MEAKFKEQQAELLRQDHLLKSSKGHMKGSRSINPLVHAHSKHPRNDHVSNMLSEDLPGDYKKKSSFIFNNPISTIVESTE